jgi:predicted MFS family arabinose efflux permease
VFVAIALGIAAFAGILAGNRTGDEWPEVMRGLIGVAMLPLFVGFAFLGLHFFANESKRRQG